jgi:chemosensory pili system protein ChpA (sensor histidine kinase/response regulator)
VSDAFDIGPLTWVHDEIKLALDQAVVHLDAFEQRPENVSALKHVLTHLNQVNGALDMVGLEGCKRFCFEIETIVVCIEKQLLSSGTEVFEQIKQAIKQLEYYLQALLNGQPNQSLRLYDGLVKLATLRGEEIEPSVLFFPDLNQSAPKDNQPQITLPDSEAPTFFNAQRIHFQRFLISWLKAQDSDILQGMRTALEQVQQVQVQNSQRTFWWVALAFVDVLAQEVIITHPHVKKIFRRIDQQLRALESGNNRANQSLMKDMLYFIAIAEASSEIVINAKTIFSLQLLIPKAKQQYSSAEAQSVEALGSEVIGPMLQELEAIKLAWTQVSKAEEGAFARFVSQTQTLLNLSDGLSHQAIIKIVVALNVFAQVWDESGQAPSDDALVEVAAGLALLEDALRDYQHLNQDAEQHLITQAQRIKNISDSVMGEDASLANASHDLAEDALVALASQIKEALNTCEQVIDTFFRNPQQTELLHQVDEPIKSMIAAFDMINMQVPMEVVTVSHHLIRMFAIQTATPSQFESLADSLSLLALFVEDFPRINESRLQTLETSLIQLTEALQQSPQEDDLLPVLESPSSAIRLNNVSPLVMIDDEVQEIFLQEAEEVLASIAQSIQALRINITDSKVLDDLRRGFHTLKGSGRMVGLAGLGELAWMAEGLLNQVIDQTVTLDVQVVNFTENASVEIAKWLPSLKSRWATDVDLVEWEKSLADLSLALSDKPRAAIVEEVLIGGTRKISKALFDIFIEEAFQHIQVLKTSQAALEKEGGLKTMELVRRAAHTLASNAGAAGFKAIEDLSRNFEFWLDLEEIDWSASAIKRFADCVSALDAMLEKAKALRQPKQLTSLLKSIKQAVEMANQPSKMVVQEQLNDIVEQSIVKDIKSADPLPFIDTVDDGLIAAFAEEANDLLKQSGFALRHWQSHPNSLNHAEDLQRALHTLKGSSRMVGQAELGDAVHAMEDLLSTSMNGEPGNINFDALFRHLDLLADYLETKPLDNQEIQNEQSVVVTPTLGETKQEANAQPLRLRADVLDRLINEAGEISIARSRVEREMQGFKQYSLDLTESLTRLKMQLREMEIEAESTLQSRLAHLQEVHESFDPLEFDRFTRLQELTRLMAESVNDVATIQHSLIQNIDETEAALSQQSRMNRELQYALINIRMVPFSSISERLHRLVRQTARELDKRVELMIEGEYVDIDRSVLEHIVGALEHLLRNAVAHGLESEDLRNKARKSLVGNITVKVRRENDEIMIHVSDDGSGINLEKIRIKAQEQGRVSAEQQLTEQALLGVIFEPGFTTASTVTQIAGRGVGLDSVRSDVSALGGRIDVANNEGAGATFSIYLPVTLSVAQVVMVRAGTLTFALPALMVEQVHKVKSMALAEAVAKGYFEWSGCIYPLHYLGSLVASEMGAESHLYTPLILLKSGHHLLALHVDEIVSNQEVVMKPIGPQLARLPGIVGASVLGDGQIIYMLNPIQIAHREELVVGSVKITHAKKTQDTRQVVLVVDDSLTMRKVLSRLLEREGYRVVTAIHGIDALQVLQEVTPDIILTDIEMPNMDGFELVRQLRSDATTIKTPIVMISSRTAEKHQALAQVLGVNDFMGKPIHDEALLENIARLLS